VDRHEARSGPLGLQAHVDVVPNMLRELVRLGVGDACVRTGFPYRRTSAVGQRGLPLFSLDAARLAGPSYPAALGITHADLHTLLAGAATQAGARLHQGARIAQFDPARPGADLVVLACGPADALREQVFRVQAQARPA